MTNAQKAECSRLARHTLLSAEEIAQQVDCSVATARRYIKWRREVVKVKVTTRKANS